MTNKEILTAALEKAKANGYSQYTDEYLQKVITGQWPWETVLFSHDFARAFWEESEVTVNDDTRFISSGVMTYGWRLHLQWMVVEDDPIKYLEKFLNK